MNKLIYWIVVIISVGFTSCKSDLLEEDYLFNYFIDADGNRSIKIDSVSIIKYDIHPTTHDTVGVKFLVNYKLSDKVFEENNILKPKFNLTTELYINEIEYPLLFEGSTKKINIYKGFGLFNNKINEMYFKFILLDNDGERAVCSDTLKFRVN